MRPHRCACAGRCGVPLRTLFATSRSNRKLFSVTLPQNLSHASWARSVVCVQLTCGKRNLKEYSFANVAFLRAGLSALDLTRRWKQAFLFGRFLENYAYHPCAFVPPLAFQ